MSKLSKYVKTYGRPFRIRRYNGKGIVALEFNDGYVTIKSIQPGTHHFVQEIHITRKAWYGLLSDPRFKQATKMMEGPSFDRYKAERTYAREEQEHLQELRAQKAQRRGRRPRRPRQPRT